MDDHMYSQIIYYCNDYSSRATSWSSCMSDAFGLTRSYPGLARGTLHAAARHSQKWGLRVKEDHLHRRKYVGGQNETLVTWKSSDSMIQCAGDHPEYIILENFPLCRTISTWCCTFPWRSVRCNSPISPTASFVWGQLAVVRGIVNDEERAGSSMRRKEGAETLGYPRRSIQHGDGRSMTGNVHMAKFIRIFSQIIPRN